MKIWAYCIRSRTGRSALTGWRRGVGEFKCVMVTQEPFCLAMVICDAVHRDPSTNKHTILGTFSAFNAAQYPATVQFSVFFALTDGAGEMQLRFRLVDSRDLLSNDAAPVFEHEFPAKFESPLVVCEGQFTVVTRLPAPGTYHCEMLTGKTTLMSRRLLAVQLGDSIHEQGS